MGTISSTATTRHDAAERAAGRAATLAAGKRRQARAHRLSEMATDIFPIPDQPPRGVALAANAAGAVRRVPAGVALAIALLVLLSSAFLVGVSRREML